MRFDRTLPAAALAAGLAAAPALAMTGATVATDLNLRAGPGPQYVIEGVIPAAGAVEVMGCVADGEWCEVSFDGTVGYAYAPYLVMGEAEASAPAPTLDVTTVETVTFDETNDGYSALLGGATAATAASILAAGPVGIAAAGVVGAIAAERADPDPVTVTYVTENPVEPVFVSSEAVVGMTVPEGVAVQAIPQSDLVYANINGDLVLIEAEGRQIVRILR